MANGTSMLTRNLPRIGIVLVSMILGLLTSTARVSILAIIIRPMS